MVTLWATLALSGTYLLSKDNESKTDGISQSQNISAPASHIVGASSAQIADILHPPRELEQKAKNDTLQYLADHPNVRERVYSMYWFTSQMRWDSAYNWLQIQQFVANVGAVDTYLSENPDIESTLVNVQWWKDYQSGILVPSQESDIVNRIQIHKLNEAKMRSFPESTRKNIIQSVWYQNMDPVTAMTAISSVDATIATMKSNPQFSQILAHYNISPDTLWRDDLSNIEVWMWKTIHTILAVEGLKNNLSTETLAMHSATIDQYNNGSVDPENMRQILAVYSHNPEDENDD